jgi:hypothetical protein
MQGVMLGEDAGLALAGNRFVVSPLLPVLAVRSPVSALGGLAQVPSGRVRIPGPGDTSQEAYRPACLLRPRTGPCFGAVGSAVRCRGTRREV